MLQHHQAQHNQQVDETQWLSISFSFLLSYFPFFTLSLDACKLNLAIFCGNVHYQVRGRNNTTPLADEPETNACIRYLKLGQTVHICKTLHTTNRGRKTCCSYCCCWQNILFLHRKIQIRYYLKIIVLTK